MFDKMIKRVVFKEKGKGAYLNHNQIHVANTDELLRSLTTIGFNNR